MMASTTASADAVAAPVTTDASGHALHHFPIPASISGVRCAGCGRLIGRQPGIVVCCVKFSYEWEPERKRRGGKR